MQNLLKIIMLHIKKNDKSIIPNTHCLLLFLILSLIKSDPSSGIAPMPAGTPVSNDLFSQALQQALQATNMSALQVN